MGRGIAKRGASGINHGVWSVEWGVYRVDRVVYGVGCEVWAVEHTMRNVASGVQGLE